MARQLYLALGDSVTAGYGASHPQLTFVGSVSAFANEKMDCARTLVVARNGWTSRDILRAAMTLPSSAWTDTHLLTLMAGGNDMRVLLRRQFFSGAPISTQAVEQQLQFFGYHMDQLCAFVSAQEIPHVVVANVYNPVPHSELAVRAMEALNQTIGEIAAHYQFGIVDVHKQFQNCEAYYIDGYRSGHLHDLSSPLRRPIHPNNAGHKQIADLITTHLQDQTRRANASEHPVHTVRLKSERPVRAARAKGATH